MTKVLSVRYLLDYDLPKYKKILEDCFNFKQGEDVKEQELVIIKVLFGDKEYTVLIHQDGDIDSVPVFLNETGKIVKNKDLKNWFARFQDGKNREIFPISGESFHHIKKKMESKEKAIKKLVKGLKRFFGDNQPGQDDLERILEVWLDEDAEHTEYFCYLFPEEEIDEEYTQKIISLFREKY